MHCRLFRTLEKEDQHYPRWLVSIGMPESELTSSTSQSRRATCMTRLCLSRRGSTSWRHYLRITDICFVPRSKIITEATPIIGGETMTITPFHRSAGSVEARSPCEADSALVVLFAWCTLLAGPALGCPSRPSSITSSLCGTRCPLLAMHGNVPRAYYSIFRPSPSLARSPLSKLAMRQAGLHTLLHIITYPP